jgi:hypothetical protein
MKNGAAKVSFFVREDNKEKLIYEQLPLMKKTIITIAFLLHFQNDYSFQAFIRTNKPNQIFIDSSWNHY